MRTAPRCIVETTGISVQRRDAGHSRKWLDLHKHAEEKLKRVQRRERINGRLWRSGNGDRGINRSRYSFPRLVVSKEQKASEFRQAWIDALRDDLATLSMDPHPKPKQLKAIVSVNCCERSFVEN